MVRRVHRVHMPTSPQNFIIRIAPLTFALLWSSGFIVARYAAPDADPLTFLSARYLCAILVLVLLAIITRAPWPTNAGAIGHSLVAGILLHGGYLGGVWWAVAAGLPAGLSALISAGQPLLTALLAAPLIGERVTLRQWIGVSAGFVGIVLVLAPRLAAVDIVRLDSILVPMLVNFAAMASVTFGTFYQKRFAPSSDLRTGTCLQFIGAFIVTAPLAWATESLRFDVTVTSVTVLAWSVLVLSIGAIALLLLMIRHGDISRVAALIYLVPPLVAVEAWILFGEWLNSVQVVGLALTALGVWLAARPR